MKLVFCIISAFGFVQVNSLKYKSNILGENLTYYVNNYISFTVKQQNDEKFAYMTFEKPVTVANDLQLSVKAIREDGMEFPFPDSPSNLCTILRYQMLKKKDQMSQFNIPSTFSIIGRTCPIEESTVRLTPHVFPHKFELRNDLGCGVFTLETSLMKCEPLIKIRKKCILLIKAETQLEITASHCSNTFE